MIAPLVSLFVSVVAFAQPSPELAKLVHDSLHPGITFTIDTGQVHVCQPYHVDIVGKDPVTNRSRHVQAAIFTPQESPGMRTVLVVPPTGGENAIDRGYAKQLCARGVLAAILEGWDDDDTRDNDLGTYDRAALRTLAAAEHVLEYLAPHGRVGILGTSLGAIQASFILEYDARITSAVLIVGGDNLPEIIATSDDGSVSDVRKQQMDAHHFRSVDEYQRALDSAIRIQPSTFLGYSGAKNVAFYLGTRDTTVPTKDQYELVRAYHGSDVTEVEANHFTTILRTFMEHGATVVRHFTDSL